jgi:ribonuclease VapC
MVIDTSALFAILAGEGERDQFVELILVSPTSVISVVSTVEIIISLTRQEINIDLSEVDRTLNKFGIVTEPVDPNQGLLAQQAFLRYGRSRHPARLNFGDCFSYALAKARGDTLLFKGEDFSKTDLIPAWRPS